MRVTDKLTRDERREIEALLVSEIERLERTPGLFDSDENGDSPEWSDNPVNDSLQPGSTGSHKHVDSPSDLVPLCAPVKHFVLTL